MSVLRLQRKDDYVENAVGIFRNSRDFKRLMNHANICVHKQNWEDNTEQVLVR